MSARTSARTVLLHVGAPKTGTSFVQDLLFQNRDRLADQGVLYPADRFDAHFLAALDLMQLPWGGLERQAVGAWSRLAEQARGWDGRVIVSHEILAAASPGQVRRALASFGEDAEVHVVVSVRDLVRQIPAEWQETIKHRRTVRYRAFLDHLRDPDATGSVVDWFWSVQDVPAILARWAADLPPDRVHVVTVPRPGAPSTLLWERFAGVFGLDPDAFDTSVVERANPSLGVAESALVRLINEQVNDGVLANEHYRELVRELLAHRTLSRRPGARRLVLPGDVRAWAAGLSEDWIGELAGRGYDVVGDLADLRPDPVDGTPYRDPDAAPPKQVRDAAVLSTVTLLRRAAELRGEVEDLRSRLHRAEEERDRARREAGPVLRAKQAVVARAETSRVLALGLAGYRWLRRR